MKHLFICSLLMRCYPTSPSRNCLFLVLLDYIGIPLRMLKRWVASNGIPKFPPEASYRYLLAPPFHKFLQKVEVGFEKVNMNKKGKSRRIFAT